MRLAQSDFELTHKIDLSRLGGSPIPPNLGTSSTYSPGRVTVVLDAAMMAHEVLNFHPLVNTGTTTISRPGLLEFLEATGHHPRIEAVSGTAGGEP